MWSTFQTSLGENNKFVDYLTKVFKKKIKRSKKKQAEGDGWYMFASRILHDLCSTLSHVLHHLAARELSALF